MSQEGIKKAAKAFEHLQMIRGELLEMGCKRMGTPEGNQDIALAQLLERAKDAVKWDFARITAGE